MTSILLVPVPFASDMAGKVFVVPLPRMVHGVSYRTPVLAALSSSTIVAVWTVIAPAVALVGVPMVRITVSFDSARASAILDMVADPLRLPAGIVIGLAVIM